MNTTTEFVMPAPAPWAVIKVGDQYAVARRTAMGYAQPDYYSTKREAKAALATLLRVAKVAK